MKKQSILILGGNYYPEPTGIGKYNTEMCDWLASHNYDCSIITTYPYYPHWKIQPPYQFQSFWFKKENRKIDSTNSVTIYRCPHYVPTVPTGLKRIVSDITFFVSAFLQVCFLLFQKKFDYVLVVSPPFQLGILGLMYRNLKNSYLIYHIQDLQIDAAVELGMIKYRFLVNIMLSLEKRIIKNSDIVSSISEGMISKIKSKFNRNILLFPNWVNTEVFYPIQNNQDIKIKYNLLPSDRVVLYSGAIGEKQGLQNLLNTALEVRHHTTIKFVVCGSGPYKERLTDYAAKLALKNIYFFPLQPADCFNDFLNIADVHVILQKGKDNELFMPSKLTTICAVGGLALVTAHPNTSLYRLVNDHQIGILTEPDNQVKLTEALVHALNNDHTDLKSNARKFAETHLSLDRIMSNSFAPNPPAGLLQLQPTHRRKLFSSSPGKKTEVLFK